MDVAARKEVGETRLCGVVVRARMGRVFRC